VQWYLNVPTLRNTRLKVSPGASDPESHTPLIDVVVWVVFPAFVHRTLVPFAMVIVAGLKAKLTIFTRLTEVGADGVVLCRAPRPTATLGTCNAPTSTTATNPVPTRIEMFRISHIPSSTAPNVQYYESGAGSDVVWPSGSEAVPHLAVLRDV
jgi:hypothetical protein